MGKKESEIVQKRQGIDLTGVPCGRNVAESQLEVK